jgi:hypothetical protein
MSRTTKRYLILGLLAMSVGVASFVWYNSVYGWHLISDPEDEFGLEFRFLGCNDDWPDNQPYEPVIKSLAAGSGITYNVRDPAACGYSVRNPKYKLAGDTLNLSYDLYTPSGEVAACICEYKTEFRFQRNPEAAQVTFDHTGD